MPNQQVRRAVSLPAFGHVDGAGTTCGQGGTKQRFVTNSRIYQEMIGLEQFGRRGPDGDIRFSRNRLDFQRGR